MFGVWECARRSVIKTNVVMCAHTSRYTYIHINTPTPCYLGDVVPPHQVDGARREDADTVELPAVEEHLGEAVVGFWSFVGCLLACGVSVGGSGLGLGVLHTTECPNAPTPPVQQPQPHIHICINRIATRAYRAKSLAVETTPPPRDLKVGGLYDTKSTLWLCWFVCVGC